MQHYEKMSRLNYYSYQIYFDRKTDINKYIALSQNNKHPNISHGIIIVL